MLHALLHVAVELTFLYEIHWSYLIDGSHQIIATAFPVMARAKMQITHPAYQKDIPKTKMITNILQTLYTI